MSGTTIGATASLAAIQTSPGVYRYTVTLTDTGTSTIGTFWFAWVPGGDFMSQIPAAIGAPAGWGSAITSSVVNGLTGFAIQWTAGQASGSYLTAGGSSSAFTFTSTETPAQMAANAPTAVTTPTTTSVVYQQAPFSGLTETILASVACFLAGTRIATSDGEMPVEALRPGDHVVTAAGSVRPIVWTGRRRIVCRHHPDPRQVWPVRISKNALAAGVPAADLWLSPDHALAIDEMLIPVKCLVNGTTIQQIPVDSVTYHHLELATHDVILAEGAPSETWLDTGDRASLESVDAVVRVPCPPSIAGRDARLREAGSARPLIVTGPELAAIRRRLADRADPAVTAPLSAWAA